ncbi:hypothetical protein EAG_11599 [Camponotus floridanus]|uniref:Uncharacterized protein n=1 Tax=Camponotus floridanus TaxID=104421 RepID=E2A4K8_CAMFO|nr:hypothetical protein EAG_11599 [Camponotus floridanus]
MAARRVLRAWRAFRGGTCVVGYSRWLSLGVRVSGRVRKRGGGSARFGRLRKSSPTSRVGASTWVGIGSRGAGWLGKGREGERVGKICQRRRKSVGGQRGFRVASGNGGDGGGSSGAVGWNYRSPAQHQEIVTVRGRRAGGWQGPLDSAVGYGELARVAGYPFREYDEGTTEEIAREPDCDERDADDRRDYRDCDDCQRKPEDRAAAEKPDEDGDDDDYDYCYEYDEDDARAEQDAAAADDDVDGPGDTDDDAEDGSCARPRCRCPRKFLVSRAIETLCCCAVRIFLLSGLFISVGGASGGCWCGGAPSTDPSCYRSLLPAGRPFAYPQCGGRPPADYRRAVRRLTGRSRAATTSTVVVVTRGGDDVRDGDGDEDEDGGADRDEDDDYDHSYYYDDDHHDDDDDDDVGDMCGCATSTRRGLGTAAGKSARRAKSSCSVHRTPGIRDKAKWERDIHQAQFLCFNTQLRPGLVATDRDIKIQERGRQDTGGREKDRFPAAAVRPRVIRFLIYGEHLMLLVRRERKRKEAISEITVTSEIWYNIMLRELNTELTALEAEDLDVVLYDTLLFQRAIPLLRYSDRIIVSITKRAPDSTTWTIFKVTRQYTRVRA